PGQSVALRDAAAFRFSWLPDQQPRARESEDQPAVGERLHFEDVVVDGPERRRVEVGKVLAVVRGNPIGTPAPALDLTGNEPDDPVVGDGHTTDVHRVA